MKRKKETEEVEGEKFPYYIDPPLKKKLDIMIEGLKTDDAWLIIDGDEGAGKSTMAAFIMYYVSLKTGRSLSVDNFWFDAETMFKTAQENSNMLLNWDEAALGGLSRQWQNKNQQNLMLLGMTGRIKHHFIVLCVPKADKIGEYFVRDRTVGLIHVYKRRGIQKGRYVYLDKRGKEKFWEDYRRTRRRRYPTLKKFRGTFPNCFAKIIDDKKYNEKKLNAISRIGKDKEEKNVLAEQAKQDTKNLIWNMRQSGIITKEIARIRGCGVRQIEKVLKAERERREAEEKNKYVPLVYFDPRITVKIKKDRVCEKLQPTPA